MVSLVEEVEKGMVRPERIESPADLSILSRMPTEISRSRLIGEIIKSDFTFHSPDHKPFPGLEFIDRHCTSPVKKALAMVLGDGSKIPEKYRIGMSLRQVNGGEFSWLRRACMGKEGLLEYRNRDAYHLLDNDKDRDSFRNFFANNVNGAVPDFYRCDNSLVSESKVLKRCIETGKITATDAFEMFKASSDVFANRHSSMSIFQQFMEQAKDGNIDPDVVLDYYESLLTEGTEKKDRDFIKTVVSDLRYVIINFSSLRPSRVVSIIERVEPLYVGYDTIAMRSFKELSAEVVAGHIPIEAVIPMYDKRISKLKKYDFIESTSFAEGLGVFERAVEAGKFDRAEYQRLRRDFFAGLPPVSDHDITRSVERKNRNLLGLVQEHNLPFPKILNLRVPLAFSIENFMPYVVSGELPVGEVVKIYEDGIRHEDLYVEDLTVLISHSSYFTVQEAWRIYKLAMRKRDWAGSTKMSCEYAFNESEVLYPHVKSGAIDKDEVVDEFYKILVDINHNSQREYLQKFARIAIDVGGNPEKVMDAFRYGITAESKGRFTAASCGSLAELISKRGYDVDCVVKFVEDVLDDDSSYITEGAAEALGSFAELVSSGHMSLDRVVGIYQKALHGSGRNGVAKAIPALIDANPEAGMQFCSDLLESYASEIYFSTDKIRNAVTAMTDLWHGLQEYVAEYKGPFRNKLFDLTLLCAVNAGRLERSGEMFSQTNTKKVRRLDDRLFDYIEEHYTDLDPKERDTLREIILDRKRFLKEHQDLLLDGGWSSEGIVDITKDVIKIASCKQNNQEEKIYGLREALKESKYFMLSQKGPVFDLDDGMSLLLLEHLNERDSNYAYASYLYKTLSGGKTPPWTTRNRGHNLAMYNLFFQGIAHKEMTVAADKSGLELDDVPYKTLTGIPHYEAIKVPLPQTSEFVYRKCMATIPNSFIDRCRGVIEPYNGYVMRQTDKVVALGDNKILENMKKGIIYDLACVGRNPELDDITYGLVEPRLGIPIEQIPDYVRAYAHMRSLHDPDFAVNLSAGKLDEMLEMTRPSILKSLSIYASCTRKRVEQMEDGSIHPRRAGIINAMKHTLSWIGV